MPSHMAGIWQWQWYKMSGSHLVLITYTKWEIIAHLGSRRAVDPRLGHEKSNCIYLYGC